MKFQIISRDDYGQTSIIGTHDDINGAIKQCREEVTNLNFSNALTTDNKFASIEAFMVDVINDSGDINQSMVYAGNTTNGKHRILDLKTGQNNVIDSSHDVRIYIGHNEGQDFYLENHKGEPVTSLDNDMLIGKTYFFVKGV